MTENIQYISITHRDKSEALNDKQKCNEFNTAYLKEMSFEEIADLLEAGCTIGRVGNTTSSVWLDYDNSSINISTVIEKTKENPDYRVSYSASNNPLKYHVLVNLHRNITRDEYASVVKEEHEKLFNLCTAGTRGNYMEIDRNAANFYQCFFGESVDYRIDYILDNSRRLYSWVKKDSEPRFYIEKAIKYRPSLNSADYCRKNKLLTIKEENRFDVYLPSMWRNPKKIKEGSRYSRSRIIGTKLMLRLFYLNHKFNENWTKLDFLDTFEWAIRTNVVKPEEFCNSSDYKGLVNFFDLKWSILSKWSFDEIQADLEPYFDCAKRQYKSRMYNPTVMSQLIMDHRFDDNKILFTDKEELMNLCNELTINHYKFIAFAKALKFDVVYECVSDKRQKYDCSDMTVEQFNQYCKEHNINRMTKSRLKKKYNIRDVT